MNVFRYKSHTVITSDNTKFVSFSLIKEKLCKCCFSCCIIPVTGPLQLGCENLENLKFGLQTIKTSNLIKMA